MGILEVDVDTVFCHAKNVCLGSGICSESSAAMFSYRDVVPIPFRFWNIILSVFLGLVSDIWLPTQVSVSMESVCCMGSLFRLFLTEFLLSIGVSELLFSVDI